MSPWRVGLLVAGSVFVAAWFAAATTVRQGDLPGSGGAPAVTPAPAAAAYTELEAAPDLARSMSRLRERLATAPPPRIGDRNPFRFDAPAAPDATAASGPSPLPGAASSDGGTHEEFAEVPADRSGIVLSGIATSATAEAEPALTAILTVRTGEVLLVRTGDALPGGWRVAQVTETAVTLANAEGVTRRLDLP